MEGARRRTGLNWHVRTLLASLPAEQREVLALGAEVPIVARGAAR
jgi:hypothetical protein